MRSPSTVVVALVLAAAGALTRPAEAQTSRIAGPSIERFAAGDGAGVTAVNFRRTDFTRGGAGLDVAIGLLPRYLSSRQLVLDLDAGFAYVAATGPATLLLKGGATSFLALGGDQMVYPGVQAGFAAVVPVESRCSVRLDLSRRLYFIPDQGSLGMWSVGIGLAVGPSR